MAALLSVSCSCERDADSLEHLPPEKAGQPVAKATQAPSQKDPIDGDPIDQSEMVRGAVSEVHAYTRAAAGKDWEAADAFWMGGKAPARPGDQVLRRLERRQAMRIINQPPVYLDQRSPPNALEIPVALRINDSRAAATSSAGSAHAAMAKNARSLAHRWLLPWTRLGNIEAAFTAAGYGACSFPGVT